MLGLDEESWPPVMPMDGFGGAECTPWADMDSEQLEAAQTLGWKENTWEEDAGKYKRVNYQWDSLSAAQQKAAELLDFDEDVWDDLSYLDGSYEVVDTTDDGDEPQPEEPTTFQMPGIDDDDPNRAGFTQLARGTSGAGKATITQGFRPIAGDTLHIVRARELRQCQRECSLPAAAAAVVMKKFGWDMQLVRAEFIKCERDQFKCAPPTPSPTA